MRAKIEEMLIFGAFYRSEKFCATLLCFRTNRARTQNDKERVPFRSGGDYYDKKSRE
jgi:hypothetical protein